ncbi:hypothetical protein QFC24_007040 [Naganishia onofrii]|uniref:Uncharacterized protein n=1 Tax=Naganishia onofrii TaxID=1851511 RepID=A0ACC2WUJ1_9TREE|nr:hypothetical protein QFC24_007040 [Naganishia onofrii]
MGDFASVLDIEHADDISKFPRQYAKSSSTPIVSGNSAQHTRAISPREQSDGVSLGDLLSTNMHPRLILGHGRSTDTALRFCNLFKHDALVVKYVQNSTIPIIGVTNDLKWVNVFTMHRLCSWISPDSNPSDEESTQLFDAYRMDGFMSPSLRAEYSRKVCVYKRPRLIYSHHAMTPPTSKKIRMTGSAVYRDTTWDQGAQFEIRAGSACPRDWEQAPWKFVVSF